MFFLPSPTLNSAFYHIWAKVLAKSFIWYEALQYLLFFEFFSTKSQNIFWPFWWKQPISNPYTSKKFIRFEWKSVYSKCGEGFVSSVIGWTWYESIVTHRLPFIFNFFFQFKFDEELAIPYTYVITNQECFSSIMTHFANFGQYKGFISSIASIKECSPAKENSNIWL